MNKQKVIPYDLLDIIFQDRNKTYGAYELRKNYHRRAKRSFLLAFTIISVAFAIPVLASMFSKPPVIHVLPTKPHIPDIVIDVDPPICPPRTLIPHGGHTGITTPVVVNTDSIPTSQDSLVQMKSTGGDPSPGDFPSGEGNGTATTSSGVINNPTPPMPPNPTPPDLIMDGLAAEVNAEFPGGQDALSAFIRENIRFTKDALNENLKGKVVVSFIVNKSGELSDFEILRSVGYGMDEDVLRVMHHMPRWKVANYNGHPVSVRYTLPISLETTD